MRKFKYRMGEMIANEQVGKIKVISRWRGRDINFYDVLMIKNGYTWTFDESEMLKGHVMRRKNVN